MSRMNQWHQRRREKFLILSGTPRAFPSRRSDERRWPLSCSCHLHSVISRHLTVNAAKYWPQKGKVRRWQSLVRKRWPVLLRSRWPLCPVRSQGQTTRQSQNSVRKWVSLSLSYTKRARLCSPLWTGKGCLLFRVLSFSRLESSVNRSQGVCECVWVGHVCVRVCV